MDGRCFFTHAPIAEIERHTMSFGEHLEQLRAALVKACLWLAVGTAIGLYFSEHVVQWMSEPFRQQLRQYHVDRMAVTFQQAIGTRPPDYFLEFLERQQVIPRSGYVLEAPELNSSMDFREAAASPRHAWLQWLADGHITNLRRHVWLEPIPDSLNSFGIFEGFFIYLQASLIVGVVLALPGMFWHLWNFIAAGLYPHERRKVYTLLPMAIVLFIAGASLAYFVMIDLLIEVMLRYNVGLGIEIQPRIKDCSLPGHVDAADLWALISITDGNDDTEHVGTGIHPSLHRASEAGSAGHHSCIHAAHAGRSLHVHRLDDSPRLALLRRHRAQPLVAPAEGLLT